MTSQTPESSPVQSLESDPAKAEPSGDQAMEPETVSEIVPSVFSHLEELPPGAFSIALGISGLGAAWLAMAQWPVSEDYDPRLVSSTQIGNFLLVIGAVCFVVLVIGYLGKIVLYRQRALEDMKDPGASNFFAAFSMCPMIFAAGLLPTHPVAGEISWLVGAILHLLGTIRQIHFWITHNFEIQATSPAWFIPLSGCLLAPITGTQLGYTELSWILFSMGFGFWGGLFVIVLNRIIYHDQLPARYVPTLFLLMAPPALAFSSYVRFNGGDLDPFANGIYHFALTASILVLSLIRLFARLQFSLNWWAYTFPMDAMAYASITYAQLSGSSFGRVTAHTFLIVASAIVAMVLAMTVHLAARHPIFHRQEQASNQPQTHD